MAEEKKGKKEEKKATIKKQNPSVLKWGFLSFNCLILLLGLYLVYSSTFISNSITNFSEKELEQQLEESHAQELLVNSLIYTMQTFTVNLDGIPRRLIQLQVNLEMLDAEGFEEIVSVESKVRDTIINILNAKSFIEIESVQGKLHLKNQIINQINNFLRRGIVKSLYFSNFAVQ